MGSTNCYSGYMWWVLVWDIVKDIQYTASNLDYVIQQLKKVDTTKPQRLSFTPWKEKRGLSSNGQIHLWFDQIAKQLGYLSEAKSESYIKSSCKVIFGIDILLGSESGLAKSVIRTLERIDYWSLDWTNKIDVVAGITVTSIFTTSEMKVFMEQMIFYWNDKDVPIKFKDK